MIGFAVFLNGDIVTLTLNIVINIAGFALDIDNRVLSKNSVEVLTTINIDEGLLEKSFRGGGVNCLYGSITAEGLHLIVIFVVISIKIKPDLLDK